jgi:hypothetical protein
MKTIKITKCLFPITNDNSEGVAQPQIEGMQCITYSMVNIDGKQYEQFEFIPSHLNLCKGGNAIRKGDSIQVLEDGQLA